MRCLPRKLFPAVLIIAAAVCLAPVPPGIAAAPARRTEWVRMRDGVRLSTDVHLPEGAGPFPTVLVRTTYNKDGIAGFAGQGTQRGYAVVAQDTRGRFASEGENLPFEGDMMGAQQDGYDTLEWLAAQPWCSGRIGTFGGSALGITQLGEAGAGSSRLTAQHITVGAPSLYDHCVYPGGIFKKAMIEDWLRSTRHAPESLARWESHPTYDGYWRQRDLTGRYHRVNTPAVHIGGWFDIFAQGTLDAFQGYQQRGGPRARGRQKLLMGPWTHGVLQDRAGQLPFRGARTPPGGVHDPWRWFDHQLKGERNGMESLPAVTYYVMGDVFDPNAPGNSWRTADRWPPLPTRAVPYYLHADRTVSTTRAGKGGTLEYRADPDDPVPTAGGPQLTLPAGPQEQRAVEGRPDVLVFSAAPLEATLEVTGRVRARLWISSDAPDTDFFVRLCDVYPDGRSFNVCEGLLRTRFRDGFDRERLLESGRQHALDVDLWSTSIIFNRGHRLRVHVTSSSAPGYDPNPNTGAPFRRGTGKRVAKNSVLVDGRRASRLILPVPTSSLAER